MMIVSKTFPATKITRRSAYYKFNSWSWWCYYLFIISHSTAQSHSAAVHHHNSVLNNTISIRQKTSILRICTIHCVFVFFFNIPACTMHMHACREWMNTWDLGLEIWWRCIPLFCLFSRKIYQKTTSIGSGVSLNFYRAFSYLQNSKNTLKFHNNDRF